MLDLRQIARRAEAVAQRLGWRIPLHARVADLPVGTQQRVEILKALLGDARILLFDEPTAVLAPNEIDELFGVLRALRDEGRSLVFVSHKLGEVMALCDRVTVLRRGRMAGTVAVSETSPEDLARRMVGESGPPRPPRPSWREPAGTRPEGGGATGSLPEWGHELSSPSPTRPPRLQADAVALPDISFTLAPGEILGVAGVDGNGQAELAQALTGPAPLDRRHSRRCTARRSPACAPRTWPGTASP